MDNISEAKENQKLPERRVIRLNEDFHPFDHDVNLIVKRTFSQRESPDFDALETRIELATENDLRIPIDMLLFSVSFWQHGHTVLPFDSEKGYRIDSDDFNLENRIAKLNRLGEEKLSKFMDFSKRHYELFVAGNVPSLIENAIVKKVSGDRYRFPQEKLSLLGKLRLLLRLPDESFEAKPFEPSLTRGDLWFKDFYPTDSGPLSASTDGLQSPILQLIMQREGFNILLPDDPEKLKQIKMRFVLAEEKPDRGGEN
ncbi:MAG: hypothetical protein HYT07_04050 [Candidatus Levybacteria bacterium]|nr:hypothetical protein [Candidatus Levybacteria bacterium]